MEARWFCRLGGSFFVLPLILLCIVGARAQQDPIEIQVAQQACPPAPPVAACRENEVCVNGVVIKAQFPKGFEPDKRYPSSQPLFFYTGADPQFTFDRYDGNHVIALWSYTLKGDCVIGERTVAELRYGAKPFGDTTLCMNQWLKYITVVTTPRRSGFRLYLKDGVNVRDIIWQPWSKDLGCTSLSLPYPQMQKQLSSPAGPENCDTCTVKFDDLELVAGCCYEVIPISFADPGRIGLIIRDLAIQRPVPAGDSKVEWIPGVSVQVYGSTYLLPTASTAKSLESGNVKMLVGTGIGETTKVESSYTALTPISAENGNTPKAFIAVRGSATDIKWIKELVAKLDVRPAIIDLEVCVCETTAVDLQDLGVDVKSLLPSANPSKDGVGVYTDGLNLFFKELGRSGTTPGREFEAFSLGDFFRSTPVDVHALLTALSESKKIEIIAKPTLSTLDGQSASYFVGDKVPYVSTLPNASVIGITTPGVLFANVGVELQFIPRLDEFGETITIQVQPVISTLGPETQLGGGIVSPTFSVRQVNSIVRVKDGETFVLAGLIKEEERESIRKVPLLGDLPLVGKLFRSTHNDKSRSDICVLVTPRIRQDPGV